MYILFFWEKKMFGRISYTWSLMKASMNVLKKDKELLIFSLLSGICCILVLVSFAIPMFTTNLVPGENATQQDEIVFYSVLFLFYFCNYFVIVFFNSAIISCAIVRMKGGDPTLGDGFSAAFSRIQYIAGWALLAATVGLILRIIEDKNEKIGRFIAGLLGMAWTVITFLAVPVLVVEKKGPIAAFKESAVLLKKTWGEQLIGGFGFGLIFFLLNIPGFLLIILGIFMGPPGLFVMIGLGVLYFIVVALIQSALQAIFQAAVYLYAKEGSVSSDFGEGMLQGAMRQR
jgi:hypothetical protein